MSTKRVEAIDTMSDDHPSLCASLDDFEQNEHPSPILRRPSSHTDFKLDDSEAEMDSNSEEPWSPPATCNRWFRHQPYLESPRLRPSGSPHSRSSGSPSKSRETSPEYESAQEEEGEEDHTIPAKIPLPPASVSPVKAEPPSPSPNPEKGQASRQDFELAEDSPAGDENPNNYFRFAVRAEVQHRTESFEAGLTWLRNLIDQSTKSRSTLGMYTTIALLSFTIFVVLTRPPIEPPVPDLIKVATLTRSFEPLMFYSENSLSQIGALQETSVAVWDLSETVRAANLTSAPLLVQELDDLGESLKTLSMELTKFFADVDGDIDGILIVMDWAKRELAALPSLPPSALSSALTNIHTLFSRLGLFEQHSTGLPTHLGSIMTELFGMTGPQRTRHTLQRTFTEFLSVLEESINAELTYSTNLFALFETIDRQFLNLQRTTIRESDNQERLEGEFLSSLWTRVLGPNASQLRSYEKNKLLLTSLRGRTISNKNLLVDHNGKLVALKQNLEALRRRLVSPLVRGANKSTISVEEQIRGLEGTHQHLKSVRETQKRRALEILFGGERRRVTIEREKGAVEIEAS